MPGIINLLKIGLLFIYFIIRISLQTIFAKKLLKPYITEYPTDEQGKPRDRVVTKMFVYSAVAIFSIWEYAKVFERKISKTDREIATILSAMMIGYDVLIDDYDISEEAVAKMLKQPEKYDSQNYLEQIMLNLYKALMERVDKDRKKELVELLLEINHIQIQSKKQTLESTPVEEVRRITMEKGGTTVLLFLEFLNWIDNQQVRDAFYSLEGAGCSLMMTMQISIKTENKGCGHYSPSKKTKLVQIN